MKIFVLTLFAMFVTASLFLGCDEGMEMMKPVVENSMEAEKESAPEPAPMPTVVSISYYFIEERIPEAQILSPSTWSEVIYTEVVFSDNVPLVIADDETTSPDIRIVFPGGLEVPFDIIPHGSSGENFQMGDCKPVEENRVFLCKFVTPENSSITFSVKATTENGMMQSDPIKVNHPDAILPVGDGIAPPPPPN